MSSNGNIFRVTGPLFGEFTGHRWISLTKGQWRGVMMFSLICAWTKGWINNRNVSGLKHHRAHYDFIVMFNFMVCTGWRWPCTVSISWGKSTHHLCQIWLSFSQCSGTHFTKDNSITIQIRWKFHLALIQLLVIISRQNLAHATTAQLSCHVPNIVAITILLFGWEQNEISITFELWWKNC